MLLLNINVVVKYEKHIGIITAFCPPGATYSIFQYLGRQKKLRRPGLLGVSVHRLALGYVYIYIQICKVVIVGSFVPAMGNRTSSAPVDELPQSHFDNKQDDTLFS